MLTRGICPSEAEAEAGYFEHVAVGSTRRNGRPQTFFSLSHGTPSNPIGRTSCGV